MAGVNSCEIRQLEGNGTWTSKVGVSGTLVVGRWFGKKI